MVYQCHRVPIQFCSKASYFHVNDNFKTSALNDLKMTLDTKKLGASYSCFNYPRVQISLRFTLRLAIYELQAILRQLHRMT